MRSVSDKRFKEWTRERKGRGFTLAETLMVVAILTVIMAVAFVGVIRWRKTLLQAEYDTKAKEICIAAQNHLALAESQGLLVWVTDSTSVLKPGKQDASNTSIYYFVHNTGLAKDDENNPNYKQSVLGLMLPFGAIDENMRGGGSYLIRYEPATATVIDAFYTEESNLLDSDYGTLVALAGDANKSQRRDVTLAGSSKKSIVGYYENSESGASTIKLQAPIVHVTNGDKLTVTVVNPSYNDSWINQSTDLKLIVEEAPFIDEDGYGVQKYLILSNPDSPQPSNSKGTVYTVTLDDITDASGSFQVATDISETDWIGVNGSTEPFISGCNLRIYAAITSTKTATAPAVQSAEVKTNSLFASAERDTADSEQLDIEVSSFRHLANLTEAVSGFTGKNFNEPTSTVSFASVSAVQTTDLLWSGFKSNTNGSDTVIYYEDEGVAKPSAQGKFLPVTINSGLTLVYDGATVENEGMSAERIAHHKLSGVEIAVEGSVGIFSQLSGRDSKIKNLEVVNANIEATGTGASAGALVGTLTGGATINNVLVRNTLREDDASKSVTSAGAAGGLVGTINNGNIKACAAAVYVNSTGAGNAGGLVGAASNNTSITYSYSGGHTEQNADGAGYITYPTSQTDVTSANGNAGGLVGEYKGSTIDSCYSTCSAKGSAAGGLVGSSSSSTIKNCYVTGLVSGASASSTGAFIGSLSGTAPASSNYYYQMVNGVDVKAIGGSTDDTNVKPFDKADDDGTLATFDSIFAARTTSRAIPYNTKLAVKYNGSFAFKTMVQTMGGQEKLTEEDTKALTTHLTHHYGDWPSFEVMIVNQ